MTLLMSLSFLCLIYASVFLPYQTLCSLLYLPSLFFVHSCLFSHFCSLSYIFFLHLFFSPPLCHSFYTRSCSLLSDILLLSTALLYLPLDVFSPSCLFGHCPFPPLCLHIFYLNITYICVYIYLHIFNSPAETKKLLMLIV